MAFDDLAGVKYRDFLVSAAADVGAWNHALHDIALKTRSAGAILFHRTAMPGTPVSQGVAEGMETYWKDDWLTRDIRLRAIPIQSVQGLGTDEDCVTPDEMRHAPLYNEFLARFGLKWFAGVGFPVAGTLWCLSIQRSPAQGQFDVRQRRILKQMSRNMADVGELNHLIAEAKIVGLVSALDRLGDAWVTFDVAGRRLEQGGFLDQPGAGDLAVQPQHPLLVKAIDAVLRRAMHPDPMVHARAEMVAEVAPDRRITVKALRLSDIHAGFGRAQYLIVLRLPPPPLLPGFDVLSSRYGLTQAEARLALQLAEGRSLKSAADELGVAYETARTQLKAVFAKCGVNRQAELAVRLRGG